MREKKKMENDVNDKIELALFEIWGMQEREKYDQI